MLMGFANDKELFLISMNIETEEWFTSDKAKKNSRKHYSHFDCRTTIEDQKKYITDPKNIATHSFYPFIHYQQIFIKYNKKTNKPTEKIRDICYASHVDSCIFKYYSHLLDELYITEITRRGISSVPIAYRTDLHKNNIHFAKQAIDFIRNHDHSYIMIGDFTGFFDNLDHRYLKKQWSNLIKTDQLPDDHYAVYKNITRYSTWELKDLLSINELEDTKEGRRQLNSQKTVLTKDQFNANRSHICRNSNPFGIPQGSPISALLANIYMIDVDEQINNIVKSTNGLYMRYSDDFIIILPTEQSNAILKVKEIVSIFGKTPGLTLQPEKTQFFSFVEGNLMNCGALFDKKASLKKNHIDFLGFSFDGKSVKIRDKTTSKYYYRMHRKAKAISKNGGYTPAGKKISAKNLYKTYSIKGARCKKGNFLSYVERCEKEFPNEKSISQIKKRHMQKIHKAICG